MNNLSYCFRYLLRNRGNSVTRLVSLALGLIVALLICSYVGLNLSYGRFFPDRERVFQVYESTPQFGITGSLLEPFAPTLAEYIPNFEATTNYIDNMLQVKLGEGFVDCRMLCVGGSFFDVLDFGVVSGDVKRVLSDEGLANNEVMISERLAIKLFGGEGDYVGKEMAITDGRVYQIAGVFRTPPVNNPLGEFDVIRYLRYDPAKANWQGNDSYPTFVKLREGVAVEEVEEYMKAFMNNHELFSRLLEVWQAEYFLVGIEDSYYVDNSIRQTQIIYGILAVLALLVATFNYVLLTLSSLVSRSKTIAMMRCNGASRWDVFRMLLAETLIMIVAAIGVAVVIITCLHQELYQLLGYRVVDLFAIERIWIPALVCIVSFLVAGLIPAVLYSQVNLNWAFKHGSDNRMWWKRVLLFVQVACTTGVVCFLLTTTQQSKYIMKADLGYEYDRIVTMTYPGRASEHSAMADELSRLPFVESVGYSWQYPVWGYWGNPVVDREKQEILFSCRFEYFDEKYIETMGMEIVAGRNFTEQDAFTNTIVNEEFVRQHGWDIETAVGKNYYQNGCSRVVVGVIRDFSQAGGFVLPLAVYRMASLDNEDKENTLQLSVRLTELTPENVKRLNEVIEENYHSKWEYQLVPYVDRVKNRFVYRETMRNNVFVVSLVTLFISLIGLIGYLGNEMARRRKEIAIRKVNGATTIQILNLLSFNILWVILPAIAVGVMGAMWGSMKYVELLETLCEPLRWWIFALGAVVVLAIVYVILVFRTWRTAKANPIDMIKSE